MLVRNCYEIERLKTGIPGLDELIGGGVLKGRAITITGGPGVGKTIFATQFANECCKIGLKVLLLATEETPEELRQQASLLKLDLEKMEEDGLLEITCGLSERMKDIEWRRGKASGSFIFKKPLEYIVNSRADVVIIDNIGVYTLDASIGMFREQMDYLVNAIRENGMTGMIISDEAIDERYNKVALYSVHGAIHMFKRENPFTGNVERLMNIIKMRGTKTPSEYVRYEIRGDGIHIQND